MYSPAREIEQAVFDHFAAGLQDRQLSGSWDEYDALRIKLAESARNSPLLAKALARAAGVHEEMDLVSAAKTAAIVETLDEAAFRPAAALPPPGKRSCAPKPILRRPTRFESVTRSCGKNASKAGCPSATFARPWSPITPPAGKPKSTDGFFRPARSNPIYRSFASLTVF